ncbi:hereditary hemochromatosis protein homolog isoform X2 [Mesocricetus auratus]|uniref:Hereditary hemochromatosis protein homolog isoform X2 n=1 Tax=Mesocricetus auratus TaxID=10036 RepID=A0A3Q0CFC0_MESAU|nr:hereditary hemochromatosis protein homolog isoform X2 [Mesocricetus auratus]
MKSRDYRPAVFLLVSLLFQCDSGRSCLRETHTLHYKLTVVSPEDYWQPLLLILVYIDDELFLCYKGDSRRAEACGPRIKGHAGAETWTRETEDFQKKEEQLWRMLAGVTNYQGHNMGLPEVKVTSRRYPVGRITLTCWAFNLCLPVATLVWLQHGKPVQQFVFGPRTILPSGDGTYQTWVSIWILPGQEPEFTCHLRHQSHDIKVPAASGHGTEYFHDATGSARASAVSALPAVLLMMLTGAR